MFFPIKPSFLVAGQQSSSKIPYINVLLNYSIQISISELKAKLERLNDSNVDETDNQKVHVLNILNEIKGQIKGNSFLKNELFTLLEDIEKFTDNPLLLKETGKRSLTSELRESLRNIDTLNNLNIISNKKRES